MLCFSGSAAIVRFGIFVLKISSFFFFFAIPIKISYGTASFLTFRHSINF